IRSRVTNCERCVAHSANSHPARMCSVRRGNSQSPMNAPINLIVNAFIGAVVLLLILRLVSGWRGGQQPDDNHNEKPRLHCSTTGAKFSHTRNSADGSL